MSAGTSEFFCLICLLVCSCTAHTNITAKKKTAEFGQDVILPCKAPNNKITAVEWRRPDQDPDYYVLLYRGGRLDLVNQHSSYQNRVDLQDKEMKDGNVSLILKNVTIEDTGRFECHVDQGGKAELISSIILVVVEPDNSWKTSQIVCLVFGMVIVPYLLLAAVLYVRIRRHESEKKTLEEANQPLKGNNSETNNQLQEEKQKWETVNIHLEEWMKIGGKVKNQIQNQIQELDEMNFDTNSDPTGSDEKNQQEELKKLQEKEKKWMKTVGNLKTELQNMIQELELMGPITIEKFKPEERYICLKNISTQEIKLGGWKLELQINDREPDTYSFKESDRIQAGGIFTLSGLKKRTPGDELQMKLISNNGEIFRLV